MFCKTVTMCRLIGNRLLPGKQFYQEHAKAADVTFLSQVPCAMVHRVQVSQCPCTTVSNPDWSTGIYLEAPKSDNFTVRVGLCCSTPVTSMEVRVKKTKEN
jgi:hypothetical protein